jgi:hypothetical protein
MRNYRLVAAAIIAGLLFAIYFFVYAHPIPRASDLLSTPTSVRENGRTFSVVSVPYWDHSGDHMKCARGVIVAPLNIGVTHGSLFQITVTSVWAHQGGQWWSGAIDPTQTKESNGHKFMIAYGCASDSFKPLMPIDVVIKFNENSRPYYLRAISRQL